MKHKLTLLVFSIYFLLGIFTISDYGISWDEPVHFRRGQAYLHYFLSGELNYANLPEYDLKSAQTDPRYHERSFFQEENVYRNGLHPKEYDEGHPPLTDIFSALTNNIFHVRMGLLGDIEAHHLWSLFVSSLGVAFVFLFAYETFGIWAAITAAIILGTYPLFFAEKFFNLKDPVETSFITIAIYLFYKAIKEKRQLFVYLSALASGFALGTKFNILFILPILFLWTIYCSRDVVTRNALKSKKFIVALLLYVPLMFAVLIIFWPYLWSDPLVRLVEIFRYYQSIGVGTVYQSSYVFGFINIYPIIWISLTTPLLVILLVIFGTMFSIKEFKKNQVLVLWILWFVFPIARVSTTYFSIYGGVRQIMEYIPAIALLAGYAVSKLAAKYSRFVVIALLTINSIFVIISLHPFEALYFNKLAGGVGKAVEMGIPAAGNSFGTVYLDLVKWVNANVEKDSKIATVQGAMDTIPLYTIRGDILYDNKYFSGFEQRGEYLLSNVYNSEVDSYGFATEYLNKSLVPIYEIQVDGAVIGKVWKNANEYLEDAYRKDIEVLDIEADITNTSISIDTKENNIFVQLDISFDTDNCEKTTSGFVETSLDKTKWEKEIDPIGFGQVARMSGFDEDTFTYYFPYRAGRYIRLNIDNPNACLLNNPKIEIRGTV